MMRSKIFITTILASVLLSACNEKSKKENRDTVKSESTTTESNAIKTQSLTDKEGNTLEMSFDNSEDTATIDLNGETAQLSSQRPASGIWYKNDEYELRGKGNDIWLKKDGEVIFEHQDDKVDVEAKNDDGDILNMTFNNTEGTVRAYLNGGKQIDLVEEKAASGIWYKNDHYELRGKGNQYRLTKDGTVVFSN